MNYLSSRALSMGLLVLLLGCQSACNSQVATAESYLEEDRLVMAQTHSLNSISAGNYGHAVQLVVAQCTFDVTKEQISWGTHVLPLPPTWHKVYLLEKDHGVLIRVDGNTVATIDPKV